MSHEFDYQQYPKSHEFDYHAHMTDYFARTRREWWNIACKHTGLCNCDVWIRQCMDLETYSQGNLAVINFGNKFNIGGCNACSEMDGRAHHFDRIIGFGGNRVIAACDCMYRETDWPDWEKPDGCTCPEDGYGYMYYEEEE